MWRNYFLTATRIIRRRIGFSSLNILGLTVGLACCLLITAWILDELSFDKFHADADHVYCVFAQEGSESTPNVLAPALVESVPEVAAATRVDWLFQPLIAGDCDTSYQDVMAVDPSFFDVFSFPFKQGDPKSALNDVKSIVISASMATRFFRDTDPIGRTLTLDGRRPFTVSGVLRDLPHNSSLQFDILVPFENKIQFHRERNEEYASYGWWSASTYVKVSANCTSVRLNEKIRGFLREHWEADARDLWAVPLVDLHFENSSAKQYVYFFSIIAVVILIMACMNFINLSIAQAVKRAREVGIRKAAGAHRSNLIGQFLVETVLLAGVSLLLALGLLELALPGLNTVTGLALSLGPLYGSSILLYVVGLIIVAGLAAGAYPAFYLSGFQPVSVLKAGSTGRAGGSRLRKALLIFQFAASICLIIGTTVVYHQLEYFRTKDVGYDKEQIVNVYFRGDSNRYYHVLKDQLLRNPSFQSITASAMGLPYWRLTTQSVDWPGKDPKLDIEVAGNMVDFDFTRTFGIDLIEGRDFSSEVPSDSVSGYVINKSMADVMGLESAVGAELSLWHKAGKVIGVMRDFHFLPLKTRIQPLIFVLDPAKVGVMAARIGSENAVSAMDSLRAVWNRTVPGYPFEYTFVDEAFDASYRSIERMGRLAGGFTLLAIFIAGLGLIGLASCAAQQRTKEIGIRKVLGASVASVFHLLSKEFVILIVIANIVAWPAAYVVMSRWLQAYAYRIDVGIWLFLLPGLATLLLALVIVGCLSARAARANPVESLKYE